MRARDIKPGMGLIFDDFGRSYHAIALDRPRRYLNRWALIPISIIHHPSNYVYWAYARSLSKIRE